MVLRQFNGVFDPTLLGTALPMADATVEMQRGSRRVEKVVVWVNML